MVDGLTEVVAKLLAGMALAACLTGCNDGLSCSHQTGKSGCVIDGGKYGGYTRGMTKSDALELACQNWKPLRSDGLFLEIDGRPQLRLKSICEARAEAANSDMWMFVEREDRSRYLMLRFSDDTLTEIRFIRRGFDP